MHHLPSGPTSSDRLRRAAPRGRLVPLVLVCGLIALIAVCVPLLVPVATAGGDDPVSLDSSATAKAGGSSAVDRSAVVQLGVDGAAAPGSSAPGSPAPGSVPAAGSPAAGSPAADSPAAAPAASSGDSSATAAVADGASSSSSAPPASSPASTVKPSAARPAPSSSSAPRPATAAAGAPADPSAEGQVLALANQQRQAAGCGALSASSGLAALARAHSADMRDRDFFDHTNPDGLDPFERGDAAGVTVRAENIAFGQPDAAAVMDDWMKSPGHRANILDCDLHSLGVGVAFGPGGPWWTQDFA